jgi:signal transduction histidine kinase
MANRTPSDASGSKGDGAVESKGRIRQWAEGMRVEALANLAHELRTPLQVLHGYLDILRDEWAEKLDPEARSMLERMNSNMHDLSQTVDNIMEFVMSEAGATGRV